MGWWRAKISNSEGYLETKEMFFDYYFYETISAKEIEDNIIEIYNKRIKDKRKWHDVYFAIADCEWKFGCLSQEILAKVEEIIVSGKDIEYWKSIYAPDYALERRQKALTEFLEKLKTQNPKPMKRRQKKRITFQLKTGDVFTCYSKMYKMWGCGVVLEVRESPLYPWEEDFNYRALIAISEIVGPHSPIFEQILESRVRDVYWDGGRMCTLPRQYMFVIGNVADQIDKDYTNYFGAIEKDGQVSYNCKKRLPLQEQMVTQYDTKRVDRFSVINKPMTFFFDKNNLRTTEEILNDNSGRQFNVYFE